MISFSPIKIHNICYFPLKFKDSADNIDLYQILSEFEEFFEMKYSKPPKLVRKIGENGVLPKIAPPMKKGVSSSNIESIPRKTPNNSKSEIL